MDNLTQEELKSILSYDPETGVFLWIRSFRGKKRNEAGSLDHYGYVNIRCFKRLYKAHRLAWLYVYGSLPDGELDHVNGDPGDNRISNLRIATRLQQCTNTKIRSNNTTGFKGVSRANGRFVAFIKNGKSKYLGAFDTPEQASEAYALAAREAFGEFARVS